MNGPGDMERAEELLVQFLGELAQEEERRFVRLCKAHPVLAGDLARLYAQLRRVDEWISGGRPIRYGPSGATRERGEGTAAEVKGAEPDGTDSSKDV